MNGEREKRFGKEDLSKYKIETLIMVDGIDEEVREKVRTLEIAKKLKEKKKKVTNK